jgi:hypothetical protein
MTLPCMIVQVCAQRGQIRASHADLEIRYTQAYRNVSRMWKVIWHKQVFLINGSGFGLCVVDLANGVPGYNDEYMT